MRILSTIAGLAMLAAAMVSANAAVPILLTSATGITNVITVAEDGTAATNTLTSAASQSFSSTLANVKRIRIQGAPTGPKPRVVTLTTTATTGLRAAVATIRGTYDLQNIVVNNSTALNPDTLYTGTIQVLSPGPVTNTLNFVRGVLVTAPY